MIILFPFYLDILFLLQLLGDYLFIIIRVNIYEFSDDHK